MQAGIESCNEPALRLLFGEAVRLKDISILGVMEGAFDSVQSMHKDMNRYAALGLDEDLGDSVAPYIALHSKTQSLRERESLHVQTEKVFGRLTLIKNHLHRRQR